MDRLQSRPRAIDSDIKNGRGDHNSCLLGRERTLGVKSILFAKDEGVKKRIEVSDTVEYAKKVSSGHCLICGALNSHHLASRTVSQLELTDWQALGPLSFRYGTIAISMCYENESNMTTDTYSSYNLF